jgi:2-polyprenyl-3-methyl-5-hydroxy-6-metoxy-1,4-benzoquinol methylase
MTVRTKINWLSATVVLVLGLVVASCITNAKQRSSSERKQAAQILDASGVKGGLIVHMGCGDGRLTAALRANDSYIVHGLDTDAQNVKSARGQSC